MIFIIEQALLSYLFIFPVIEIHSSIVVRSSMFLRFIRLKSEILLDNMINVSSIIFLIDAMELNLRDSEVSSRFLWNAIFISGMGKV